MKNIKNFLLSQVSQKKLSKKDALPMLKELFENEKKTLKVDDIAIIGMACRFPNANNLDEFWDNMMNNVDSVRDFPESRRGDVDRPIRDYFKGKRNAPELKYRKGAYLDRIDLFDAEYFNISPDEAKYMDPLQRIFLEVTWEAIENAGYSEKELYGSRTGVYVGDTDADYLKLVQRMTPYALPGNTISIVASRIAYILNLASGSHLIDTACSASLSAVHHAIKGLITGDCDMAIVGGLNMTIFPVDEGLSDIGIASPDYRAKTFDANANGTVWGEGAGVVILKTLEQAKRDRDNICAVIKGSSMNSDGKSNGITAPSALAQAELIKEAWKNSGIDPETITYMEAHGTGTKLGDPIEMEGITNAFRSYTDKKQFCALGALKTNIGHLDTAAGIAGMIKVALVLQNKKIPANLHFNEPNPYINFLDSPVYINTKNMPWEVKSGVKRRAGVSAFGLAGTNCHVILEEYNGSEANKEENQRKFIFTLSAKTWLAFKVLINRYSDYMTNTTYSLSDICFTSNCGRGHHAYRLAILVSSLDELREKLNKLKRNIEGIGDTFSSGNIYYAWLQKKVEKKFSIRDRLDLDTIVSEYMSGSDIDWKAFYDLDSVSRVTLPAYPFLGKRYWVEYIPENELQAESVSKAEKNIHDWFYKTKWVEKPIDDSLKTCLKKGGKWLIFDDGEGVGKALGELLEKNGQTMIFVKEGDTFSVKDESRYQVSSKSSVDYLKLFDTLVENGQADIDGIIHLWNCCEIRSCLRKIDDLRSSQDRGVKSLFNILKAIKNSNIDKVLTIMAVSNYANLVNLEDTYIFPEKAPFWSLMKVISQENKDYHCSSVDVDTIGRENREIAWDILRELRHDSAYEDSVSAWRAEKRYTQELDRLPYTNLPKRSFKIQEEGVYLIAGGCGAVGIETCRYLAKRKRVRLAIVNRMTLPDRTKWNNLLQKGKDILLCKRIREILSLEEMGSYIHYYSADITSLSDMQRVKEDLIGRYGKINGVINMTMDLVEKPLDKISEDDFVRSMDSKVIGTWVLNEITKNQKLDFFMLYSSVASILGGVGLGGYTAANAFLDQYAWYQTRRGLEAIAINWSYLGMGIDEGEVDNSNVLAYPICSEEYEKTLDIIFKYKMPKMVIANVRREELIKALRFLKVNFSPNLERELNNCCSVGNSSIDYSELIENYEEIKELIEENEELSDNIRKNVNLGAKFVAFEERLFGIINKKSRPSASNGIESNKIPVRLYGRDRKDYSETERKLGQIYSEVLGREEININEDFFENGDSLMLMNVVAKIQDMFEIDLPIEVFFQEPTIIGLSQWIESGVEDENDDSYEISILPRNFS